MTNLLEQAINDGDRAGSNNVNQMSASELAKATVPILGAVVRALTETCLRKLKFMKAAAASA